MTRPLEEAPHTSFNRSLPPPQSGKNTCPDDDSIQARGERCAKEADEFLALWDRVKNLGRKIAVQSRW